jgi:hypothetical protein
MGVRRRAPSDRFYVYSHPGSLGSVQTRLEDIMTPRNPSDPFAARPEIGEKLRGGPARGLSLRASGRQAGAGLPKARARTRAGGA